MSFISVMYIKKDKCCRKRFYTVSLEIKSRDSKPLLRMVNMIVDISNNSFFQTQLAKVHEGSLGIFYIGDREVAYFGTCLLYL